MNCFKLSPWTIVSLGQCLLGQKSFWTNFPWAKWSLDNCPLDKCINTLFSLFKMLKNWRVIFCLLYTFNSLIYMNTSGFDRHFIYLMLVTQKYSNINKTGEWNFQQSIKHNQLEQYVEKISIHYIRTRQRKNNIGNSVLYINAT